MIIFRFCAVAFPSEGDMLNLVDVMLKDIWNAVGPIDSGRNFKNIEE